MTNRQFSRCAIGILFIAFVLREFFVLATVVPFPLQGDASAYMLYVSHLLGDGVFSMAQAGQPVVPDAYRNPGYPLFIAAVERLAGDHWYGWFLQGQVLLGTATVAALLALGRTWLPPASALLAAALLAVQPHHVAATAFLLSEVLLGAAIAGALWCATIAVSRRSLYWAVAGGALFAVAYLVNPLVALFPPLLVPLWWRSGRREAIALAAVAMLAVAGWSVRNATLPQSHAGDRAMVNLVQGSWPIYHAAYNNRLQYPAAQRMIDEIDAESALMIREPASGLRVVLDRLAQAPGAYAQWYVGKMYLLWDWEIRIGADAIYTQDVSRAPLTSNPLLRGMTRLLEAINPLLFALAFAFLPVAACRRDPGPRIVALFFLYVTAVHVVLQADPRYAIAYRGIEMLLAAGTLAFLAGALFPAREPSRVMAMPAAGARSPSPASGMDSHPAHQAGCRDKLGLSEYGPS